MYDNLKKKFGQNFLIDRNILKKITSLIKRNNLKILEIGPGDGRLTEFIISKNPNKLTLIEIDADLTEFLKIKFKKFYDVEIINDDFLKIDLKKYDLIISNLPYNISSQILAKICTNKNRPKNMVLMFQKEFAEKLIDKKLNSLNTLVNCFYKINYEFLVSKNCFRPIPKVNSSVLTFLKLDKELINTKQIEKFILFKRRIFSHKRKMIKSSISLNEEISKLDYLDKRPEELSIEKFLDIFAKSNL